MSARAAMPSCDLRRTLRCVAGGALALGLALGCRGAAPGEPGPSTSRGPAPPPPRPRTAPPPTIWCAETEPLPAPPVRVPGWRVSGREAVLEAQPDAVVVGFVADAGSGGEPALAALRRAAAAMRAEGVQLVVSLGALGGDVGSIEAALDALTADAPYLVLALAGDLEPALEHRQAVTRLQQAGRHILDGTLIRWLDLGAATLATLPGARDAEQLVAGELGCRFDDAMVERTLAPLAQARGVPVLVGWTTPRPIASSNAEGDWSLARAMVRHHVKVAIVGEPTKIAAGLGDGPPARTSTTEIISVGPLVPEPGGPLAPPRPSALLLRLTKGSWRQQRLDLPMQPRH